MTITYSTAVKNSRLQAVLDALDAGGSGACQLVIGTAAMAAELVRIFLSQPAGTISGGVLTFTGLPLSGVADNNGTAAAAILVSAGGDTIASGFSVGTGGTDLVLDSTSISAGQTVTLTAASITAG